MIVDIVNINNQDYYFCISFRAMIDFEKMADKSVDKVSSMEDFSKLSWCGLKAGARKEGKPFKLTYNQWLDMLDDDFSLLGRLTAIITEMSDKIGNSEKGKSKKK